MIPEEEDRSVDLTKLKELLSNTEELDAMVGPRLQLCVCAVPPF